LHTQKLVKLGSWEAAAEGWTALLERYGDDPELGPRVMVGWVGAVAASLFAEQKQPKFAVALADDVIACFRTSEEPRLRAAVALAMQVRVLAFRQKRRILRAARAGSELAAYLGPDPDPQVIEAMRALDPESAETWTRIGRRYERE
jgi:hypothetical protein